MTQTDAKTTVPVATARGVEPAPFPQRLRQWDLVELVAEGALTEVYRARPAGASPHQPASYALKTLRPQCQDDPRAVAVLRREALVGRTVSHPHVISLLAAAVAEPPYYVVMPWLSGNSLAVHLAGGKRLDPAVAFWVARQAAEALGALREAGWMHGDVKPSNIFLSPAGHVTLLDLGFARRIEDRGSTTQRCVAGTCNYIAPERIAPGRPIDVPSDLYSLGVVLFEMLSGRLPFRGKDAAEVARKHREARVPELARLVPELPAEACALVREMLAKEPLRRPQDPRELIDRLARLEIATFARRQAG